jgi:hypothetical protein
MVKMCNANVTFSQMETSAEKKTDQIHINPMFEMALFSIQKSFWLAGIPDTGNISWASFLKVIDWMRLPLHPTDVEMDAIIAKIDTRAAMVLRMWKKKDTRVSDASQPALALPPCDTLLNSSPLTLLKSLTEEDSQTGIKTDSTANHIRKRLTDYSAVAQGENAKCE